MKSVHAGDVVERTEDIDVGSLVVGLPKPYQMKNARQVVCLKDLSKRNT